jgi:hypothetical protein
VTDPAASGIDAFCIGYGGWISRETTEPEHFVLAAVVMQAEAEWREEGWEALALVLDCIVEGVFTWPAAPAERAAVFEAVWRLGWMGTPTSPGENPRGGAIG